MARRRKYRAILISAAVFMRRAPCPPSSASSLRANSQWNRSRRVGADRQQLITGSASLIFCCASMKSSSSLKASSREYRSDSAMFGSPISEIVQIVPEEMSRSASPASANCALRYCRACPEPGRSFRALPGRREHGIEREDTRHDHGRHGDRPVPVGDHLQGRAAHGAHACQRSTRKPSPASIATGLVL